MHWTAEVSNSCWFKARPARQAIDSGSNSAQHTELIGGQPTAASTFLGSPSLSSVENARCSCSVGVALPALSREAWRQKTRIRFRLLSSGVYFFFSQKAYRVKSETARQDEKSQMPGRVAVPSSATKTMRAALAAASRVAASPDSEGACKK